MPQDILISILMALVSVAIALVLYHHLVYPIVLKCLTRRSDDSLRDTSRGYLPSAEDNQRPSVTVLIPAFNEETVIAQKISNVLSLDYPADRLFLLVICDGCTDNTYNAAMAATTLDPEAVSRVTVVNAMENRGKVAVLNQYIPSLDTDLLALTDASAIVAVDAMLRATAHFGDEAIGAVSGRYQLLGSGSQGEDAYWRHQSQVKAAEARLGNAIGAHGAFYVIRPKAFAVMPDDTVNDDFAIPMQIIANGGRVHYDPEVLSYELEGSTLATDWCRRVRIGAGNLQQAIAFRKLLSPRFSGTAFTFFSGKFLRAWMPFIMGFALLGSLGLSLASPFFAFLAMAQTSGYGVAIFVWKHPTGPWPKAARLIHYLVQGHLANGIGATNFLLGRTRGPWRRVSVGG